MKTKYFISCVSTTAQLGAIQLECESIEDCIEKSEKICPQRAMFRSCEVEKFDENMPIGEFVTSEKMKELGY